MATIVEGDQKAPFSIATTQRCRGGRNSFPWIAPLYPWYIPYIAECYARRYQILFLKSLVWRDLGLNPDLPDHWQTLYPLGMSRLHTHTHILYIYIYIYTHTHTHTHTHVYTYVSIYIYIYIYIHTHIYIYTHKYTHTRALWRRNCLPPLT